MALSQLFEYFQIMVSMVRTKFRNGTPMHSENIAFYIGLQRFVDVIDYVDYENMSISMECDDESHLDEPE